MSIQLPEDFKLRMKDMLGNEFDLFLDCYDIPRRNTLRINTLKISAEKFKEQAPFAVEPVFWLQNGFYYRYEDAPGRHPFYHAGLFYIQEASAQVPADVLPIAAGDRVLDMCAAPGGKSTQLLAKLSGTGFLVSNDISLQRARALLRNLELAGGGNFLVLNETPARIAEKSEGFFDKVLVDAPCSGEGMFRKNEAVLADWSKEKSDGLAVLQGEILDSAYRCLKAGGMLLYSTCTFAPAEDEGAVSAFLARHPDMHLCEITPFYEGFSRGNPAWGDGSPELSKTVRLWPHKTEGEGHFLALMAKEGTDAGEEAGAAGSEPMAGKTAGRQDSAGKTGRKKNNKAKRAENTVFAMTKEERGYFEEFAASLSWQPEKEGLEARNGRLYRVKPEGNLAEGLHFLRNGLYMGEFKKGRFEPSEPLALSLKAEDCRNRLELSLDDERLPAFLEGADIPLADMESLTGWVLVCADRFPIGFGKAAGHTLKNKIPAGWRAKS